MENEELETVADVLPDTIIEPEVVIVEAPEPAETPAAETTDTISQLITTIAGLNDQISALRLEIQGERAANQTAIIDAINALESKIVSRETIAEEIENLPSETRERVTDEVSKPAKRWL